MLSRLRASEKRPALRWQMIPLLTALYCLAFLNEPLWQFWRTVTGAPQTALLPSISFLVAIAGVISAFLMPFSHPRLVRWAASVVIFLAAANAYFSMHFGTIVDTPMIRNIVETDWREAMELMTRPFGEFMLLYVALPIFILFGMRVEPVPFLKWCKKMPLFTLLAFLVAVVALGSHYKFFQLLFRQHREVRLYVNPTYPIYSLAKYFVVGDENESITVKPVALDARAPKKQPGKRPLLAIMVVGETARADHFSLNGYARDTNPELSQENVLSFRYAWSCGTSTAESLPCMFSDLGRDHYSPDKAAQRQNLLDILQRIDVNVLWIDNNSGSKGVAKRVAQLGRAEFTPNEIQQHCRPDECFDEVLVDALKRSLPTDNRDSFVVLHQLGEHGPSYYKRHPAAFTRFQPECLKDDAFNCSNEEIANAYDNDILYTDHVLARVIDELKSVEKDRDVLMLYMSDHGESLGENGVYLHGAPWAFAPDAQKHVPMILWLPATTAQNQGIDIDCMKKALDDHHDHDHLFHTFLGLFTDRKSESYEAAHDAFALCRH